MKWRSVILGLLVILAAADTASGSPLWVRNVHTREEARFEVPVASRVSDRTWRAANRFFRSWRTAKRRTMHPRLLRTLAHIQRRFGNRRIEVISGFRAPADGDELNSYHMVGRAVDLKIAGVSKEDIFLFCRTLPRMGCGFYPKAEFVHVDVRGSSGVWVDLSAPGKPRDYARSPAEWLRKRGL